MQWSWTSIGILVSIAGTLSAALLALCGRGLWTHRMVQVVLAMSTATGAVAGVVFLFGNRVPVLFDAVDVLYGLRLVLHPLAAIFFVIVNGIACAAALYAIPYVAAHQRTYHVPMVNSAVAVFVFGMQTVLLASNVIGFMFSWELMSMASFFLVMADRDEASVKAAMLYLVMTHLGAAAILAGFSVLGGGNPLLDFSALATSARSLSSPYILLAFALFFFGFGSKAGLVPLHVWLPEAHPQAPSHVSALMSGVMLKIAVYGFILTAMMLLPGLPPGIGMLVAGVGLVSAVAGSLAAAANRDIKQTLAWSSVENLGLIFCMLGVHMFAASRGMPELAGTAAAAALFHCVVHAIFKSGLFLTAGGIVHAMHTRSLERMGGLAVRMPVLSGAFLVLALGASALPPFGAFFGEWMFLRGLIHAFVGADAGTMAFLLAVFSGFVFASSMAIFAMVKLFAIACVGQPRSAAAAHAQEPPRGLVYPVLLLAVGMIMSGVAAATILRAIGMEYLVRTDRVFAPIVVSGSVLQPAGLAGMVILALVLAFLFRRLWTGDPRERTYPTWDCGQPITAAMEYTATAFSAPIRFFFRPILQNRKIVTTAAVVATNAYVRSHTMTFASRSLWMEYLHLPIARLITWKSTQIRKLQNGTIQFYLILIFLALLVALVIAV
ncbi:hypothetical protein HYV74_05080 [Candidatus Uhrbacteria bacterium]|nr:hypothetical protein [Candidatus Uhrbacteria bacterium]